MKFISLEAEGVVFKRDAQFIEEKVYENPN